MLGYSTLYPALVHGASYKLIRWKMCRSSLGMLTARCWWRTGFMTCSISWRQLCSPPNPESSPSSPDTWVFEELIAEYSDTHSSMDPLAEFYQSSQKQSESPCSYAIALEATLRTVAKSQRRAGYIDQDVKLTHQLLRGLNDEEVYTGLHQLKKAFTFLWAPGWTPKSGKGHKGGKF